MRKKLERTLTEIERTVRNESRHKHETRSSGACSSPSTVTLLDGSEWVTGYLLGANSRHALNVAATIATLRDCAKLLQMRVGDATTRGLGAMAFRTDG